MVTIGECCRVAKLISMPTSPNFVSSNWSLVRTVGTTTSPFTGKTSVVVEEVNGIETRICMDTGFTTNSEYKFFINHQQGHLIHTSTIAAQQATALILHNIRCEQLSVQSESTKYTTITNCFILFHLCISYPKSITAG